ncbi:MAG: DNA repair protein RadA [Lachnospiraceae bacterium]|nr:DNA repair protein RadA [Lachnospiraceae bacterium]
MAKEKTVFFCKECGNETAKWFGQCPACKAWDSLVEAPRDRKRPSAGVTSSFRRNVPVPLGAVSAEDEKRTGSGMKELDRVLGGGIVAGSLVLASGDPGIGKSTLLLQMCRNLSNDGVRVLYVSGEESLRQVKLRANRIGEFNDNMLFLAENNMDTVRESMMEVKPSVVVVDSIQTMVLPQLDSPAGSVTQIKEITSFLLRTAKEEEISIFVVGHVTKEGSVAGPRMLEHMVDTVLYFEGDTTTPYRILRAVKNRFGSTNEIGVFSMERNGLIEVVNPSEHMLAGMPLDEPGSIVTVTMEGTRPILVEVQALVCRTNFNLPRRSATGTDFNRLNLILAVLEKRIGIGLSGCDVYLNIAGGMRVTEPALDLGIAISVLSGYTNLPLPEGTAAFGEIGLIGEIRSVSQAAARVREAAKLGYKRCFIPKTDADRMKGQIPDGVQVIGVANVRELKKYLSGNGQS